MSPTGYTKRGGIRILIIVTAAIAGALLTFGFLEHRAHRNG
jgi:hypothetical protein